MKISRLEGIPHITTPWRGGGVDTTRDMELIRELLFEIEGGGGVRDLEAWSDEAIRRHIHLLVEAGLVHGTATGSVTFSGLSWAGHDFLAAIRQDGIWRKITCAFSTRVMLSLRRPRATLVPLPSARGSA